MVKISIQELWAVAIINKLDGKIIIHPQLFATKEDAEKCGENYSCKFVINSVFFKL